MSQWHIFEWDGVRFHIEWIGEQSNSYKGVKISSYQTRFKNIRLTTIRNRPKQTISIRSKVNWIELDQNIINFGRTLKSTKELLSCLVARFPSCCYPSYFVLGFVYFVFYVGLISLISNLSGFVRVQSKNTILKKRSFKETNVTNQLIINKNITFQKIETNKDVKNDIFFSKNEKKIKWRKYKTTGFVWFTLISIINIIN